MAETHLTQAAPAANLFRFPTIAGAPVVQRGRKGRLPASVKSIGAYRLERQRKREELVVFNVRKVKEHCLETLARVLRGEVIGLAIYEVRSGDEPDLLSAAGELADDLPYLRGALNTFLDNVAEWDEEDRG
jgi:hypothetical protein